ncbi:MAG: hypothetical protein NVV63_13215 [Opitutus sp.]|nr:hypothetical protein [Opitutus sp.]
MSHRASRLVFVFLLLASAVTHQAWAQAVDDEIERSLVEARATLESLSKRYLRNHPIMLEQNAVIAELERQAAQSPRERGNCAKRGSVLHGLTRATPIAIPPGRHSACASK